MPDEKKEIKLPEKLSNLFDTVVTDLKKEAPDKKEVLAQIKEGLKAYSGTMQQIVKDIALDYLAYQRNEFSDDPEENEEHYKLNLEARKSALEAYKDKILEDEVQVLKGFFDKIVDAAIPILSTAVKTLMTLLLA